jgi:hypothetical protein
MSAEVYQFDISRATKAADLHALLADIQADETLTSDEKDDLCQQISLRFSALNALAAGPQKPRW